MKRHCLTQLLLSTALLVFGGAALHAGSPRVTSVFPAGGQRGAEGEIECRGGNLEDAKGLLFDEPGFEVTPVAAEKNKFKVKVKIAPDARLGEHTFRVITASGVADVRLYYVSPFPMVAEVENDKKEGTPSAPQEVPLGVTVYGTTPDEDQDRFVIEAKKGERISAEVIAARFQTQRIYDPLLAITTLDGKPLISVDDTAFTRQDPVASIIAPEDGKYIVSIKEATNSGRGECEYLLNIGKFPRPLAVYPPGAPAGEEAKFTLLGDASGPLEKTIKLPESAVDHFELFPEEGQPAPQPNFIRVSKFPNVLEAEPNNEPAKGTPTDHALPLAFNGIVSEKGDADFFKFRAKKGESFDVRVFARHLRSPLDPVLSIYDAKGNRIAQNDDSGGIDSYLRWNAPADGEFSVAITDQLSRGGPLFTYRIEITPVEPRIAVWLPEMVPNSSQERRAIVVPKGNRYASLVRVKRNDIGGDLELTPHQMLSGVTAEGKLMDKSVDTIPVVFEAAPDATPASAPFTIVAKPVANEKPVESEVEHEVDVAENGNQKSFYSVKEHRLTAAITEPVPVKINLVQPKVPVLQSGSLNLKVVAERQDNFKGPINIALLYTPPGIGSAGTVQIKENENEAHVTISANGNAPLQKWQVCVVGNADFGKGPVWFSTQLVDIQVAAPFVGGKIARTFVDQGESTTVSVKLDQKIPFEGKAKVALLGLPPNTTAEEQEITKDDSEVKFTVKTEKTAPVAQHKQLFCQFNLVKDGETMTNSFANGGILRIDKASVAKNEEPKK
jgi:hypothetical protein